MRGTILRRDVLEDTRDHTRRWRAWLKDWSEDAVRSIEYLGLFSHRDSYGGDWADIIFRNENHMVPIDEFEKVALVWLNTNIKKRQLIFIVPLWDLFFGVYRRDTDKIVFKKIWQWFVEHKSELNEYPNSGEYYFQQILNLIP